MSEPARDPMAAAAMALSAKLLFELVALGRLTVEDGEAITDSAAHLARALGGDAAEAEVIKVMAALNDLRGLPPADGSPPPPA